jgi:hypothetical protein
MTRESNSGVTKWSVEEGALNRELETLDTASAPDPLPPKMVLRQASDSASTAG